MSDRPHTRVVDELLATLWPTANYQTPPACDNIHNFRNQWRRIIESFGWTTYPKIDRCLTPLVDLLIADSRFHAVPVLAVLIVALVDRIDIDSETDDMQIAFAIDDDDVVNDIDVGTDRFLLSVAQKAPFWRQLPYREKDDVEVNPILASPVAYALRWNLYQLSDYLRALADGPPANNIEE